MSNACTSLMMGDDYNEETDAKLQVVCLRLCKYSGQQETVEMF